MPPSGLSKTFSFKTLLFIPLFCVFVISLLGLVNPDPASAGYRRDGSRCFFDYGDMEGHILSMEVDMRFCEGGDPGGSCNPRDYGDCEDMGVPGKGGINGCYPNGEIKVRYDFDGNPGTVDADQSGAPTGILFDAKCDSTWSDGGGHDYHLNIDYLNEDEGWRSIRHGNVGSQEDFKIENGDSSKYVPMSLLKDDMGNYDMAKAFVFYPNCAGRSDSVDGGCFRTADLEAHIVDPYKPTCSVTSTKVGSDFSINVSGNDQGTGILRIGLSYTPVDINQNPIGGEVIQVNNDFVFPEGRNSMSQTFTIPGSIVSSGQIYTVKAKVWDVKGSNAYLGNDDYSANYNECTTLLQCIMPTPETVVNYSCTPAVNSSGVNYSDSIVTANNLNQGNRCQIDYVNISESSNFGYPNYWNRNITGFGSVSIPQSFTKTDTKAQLVMYGPKTYWISYWDQQSGQTSEIRSFSLPATCKAPTGVPTITYTPECKVDPGNINDPANSKRNLVWNAIPSSQRGDGFLGYRIEVWRSSSLAYTTAAGPTATSVPLGAWWVTELLAGNTYSYRIRGESLGGLGPWTTINAATTRILIKKPSVPVNFRRIAYSSGLYTGNPYQEMGWSYSDTAAPVATLDGWKMEVINPTIGNIESRLPGSSRVFRHNMTQAQCNDTSYTYRLSGVNTCGTGTSVSGTYTCPKNKPPTCNPIQYSTDNGVNWSNYPTGSGGRTQNPSTTLLIRRHCVDDELNSIRYEWTTSTGCGTFNPAVQTKTSPHVDGGRAIYTFSASYNMGCNITSKVSDSAGNIVPDAVVVAKTYPFPNAGSHTISLGARSIQRSNTTNAYSVFSGVTQDLATVRYNIVGYDNLTAQGSSTNRPGTATINTTTADLGGGKVNICHPTYGTCTFANPTNNPNITANRINNIIAVNSNYDINVRLSSTHEPNIRDIMVDPSTTNIKYAVRINFSSTGANTTAISAVANGSPRIINSAPTCSGVTFGPVPGSPYRQGNITVGVTGKDDWGLRGLAITYQRLSGGTITTVVNNPTQFNARLGTASFDVSTANMSSGFYRFNISMTDGDGSSVNCIAAGNITGDETGTTPTPGDPPIILIDKQVPQCGTGGMTVTPNASGDLLGFTVAGTDPTAGASFSGLSRVHILAKRPNQTGYAAAPVLSFNIPNTPKPQTYTHTFSNASATTAYNLAGLPSGVYSFRAVWTDRAGNVSATTTSAATPCDVTFEKTSRISGKVNMFTGIDGLQKRDYAREATGAQFSLVTKTAYNLPGTSVNWQNATPAACTATYPGAAGLSSCDAYFVSGATYSTQTPPVIELSFPRLASDSVLGKYRCSMSVWNTTTSPWSLKRPVVPNNDPAGSGATCSGTTCVCRFVLSSFDMTVDPNNPYSATSLWPTHVEFDISYNSDQVYGRVENEMGNTLAGNMITVNRGAWTSPPTPVTVTGAYRAPLPTPDNPSNYGRTNQPINVSLINSDPTRLCVWAARNNFSNPADPAATPKADAQRIAASTTFATASVRDVAQDLALTGFTVGANSQCTTQGLSLNSGPISPKNQNQVNFLVLPKVQLTGQIYYLKSDNCAVDWTDPDNWSEDTPIDVDLNFNTINPAASGPWDGFYNPTNPASNTGAATYTTGQTYTVYANALPGSNWNNWQIQTNVNPPSARFTTCGDGIVGVNAAIPNYPTGVNATVINAPIAVYMREGNDWWQTYNGGAHGFNAIANNIPAGDADREDLCGHDVHTIVGRGTCGMYNAGTPLLRNPPFRAYATGGLVTTRGNLGVAAGRTPSFNWRISSNVLWSDPEMKGLRLPFTSSDGGELTVIEKVDALGTAEGWVRNPANLSTVIGAAGGGRVYLNGNQTINTPLTFGNNNYLVVNGNLTINANLLASGTDMRQMTFIIASGDVAIGADVTELNAYIYTPGNITIRSNGADDADEVQLKVFGGLYAGGNVDFQRDLINTDENWGYPTTQIMFNPSLVISSRRPNFPSQLKETNVYWTQE